MHDVTVDGNIEILGKPNQYDDYDTRWFSEPEEALLDLTKGVFVCADGEIIGRLNSDEIYDDAAGLYYMFKDFRR